MTKKTKNERKRGPLGPLQAALALRLRSLREARFPPVTQVEIARLVGRSKSAVCLWESGENEPSFANLVKLAEFYGVTVNSLLGLEDAPSTPQHESRNDFPTVPVLAEADMLTWTIARTAPKMVTRQPYDWGEAAAIRVGSPALASVCPMGAYAVVARGEKVNADEVVLVAVDGEKAPLIRKVVRDGSTLLLIADDTRYPTVHLNERARIIGRVVETVEFRTL